MIEHTTSEAAGQLVDGSWIARSGFLCLGFAVLWLARTRGGTRLWGAGGTFCHRVFGIGMVATAVFATRSWVASRPYDPTEDLLHSAASSAVGAGFLVGVLLVGMHRGRITGRARWYDVTALVAAAGFLLAMTIVEDLQGLIQRGMFATAYLWYGTESLASDLPPQAARPPLSPSSG